jgi:Trk K+ transport system NAD-binding subunit
MPLAHYSVRRNSLEDMPMAEETVTPVATEATATETPNWDDELTAAGIPVAASVAATTEADADKIVAAELADTATAAKTRVNNPMDDFRETLRQMGAVIGEGATSFLLAEFFGVSDIDELEGADVFSALEKFNKLQP